MAAADHHWWTSRHCEPPSPSATTVPPHILQPPSRVIFSTRKPWQQLHASSLHYLCTSCTLPWAPLRILHAAATTITAKAPSSLQNSSGNANLHHRELHLTTPATPANQNLHEPDSRPTIQQPFHAPTVNVLPSPPCLKHPCHRTSINVCEPDPLQHQIHCSTRSITAPDSNLHNSPASNQNGTPLPEVPAAETTVEESERRSKP